MNRRTRFRHLISFVGLTALTTPLVITASTSEAHAFSLSWTYDWISDVPGYEWVKDKGYEVGEFFVRDVWGRILTSFTCGQGDAGGIATACFSANDPYFRLITAMNFINVDPRSYLRGIKGQETYSPKDFVHDKIVYFVAGDAWEASALTLGSCSDTANACSLALPGTSGPVVVYPRAYSAYPNDSQLAAMIVHEADHGRFGSHSCGDYADANEDGPYGTQIQYLARVAARGNLGLATPMSMLDREAAWQLGMSKLDAICNASARQWLSDVPLAAFARIKAAPPGGGGVWR